MASEEMSQLCEAREKPKCEYCGSMYSANELLLKASGQGRVECVEHALAKGASVNCRNWECITPLMLASQKGHADCVNVLIEAGADVNKKSFTRRRRYIGNTALILAAEGGHDKCLLYLIEAGANLNERTRSGNTALMCASQTDSHESVNILIKAGANVNARKKGCNTALMHASKTGSHVTVYILIKAGANVNMANGKKDTALILAVQSGSNKSVNILIKAGADVDYRSRYLLDRARVSRKVTIMKSLFQAGIRINTRQPNVLPWYTTKRRSKADEIIFRMLHAAGEYTKEQKTELDLMAQCRRAIRKTSAGVGSARPSVPQGSQVGTSQVIAALPGVQCKHLR